MNKKTQIFIGVAAVGVAYLLWLWQRSSKQDVNSNIQTDRDTPYMPTVKPEIASAYMDVVIPKGTKIEGAKVFGYGVSFNTDKVNEYDYGIGQAKFGEFDVTSIVSYERQDPAPFEQPKVVNGYSLYIGNIVNVVLTKDVVRSVPTKTIIYT